jgi:putative ABC transport system substrate-binding protein
VAILFPVFSAPVPAVAAAEVYRIGFLTPGSHELFKPWLTAFRQGLKALGYVEGENIIIEQRFAAGWANRLPALAAELVRLKIDIFVVHGIRAIQIAYKASRTIPIVFPVAGDPVGSGLVTSLARPGGNVTGLSDFHGNIAPKRLELLKEMAPSASRIAVLWNPANASNVRQLRDLQAAASTLGVSLIPLAVKVPEDLDRAFAAMRKEPPDALNIFGYPLMGINRHKIAAFALKHRLPSILTVSVFPEAGGLMSYGTDFKDLYRRAAGFVDKILKGAKPADLPVEQPTKFELVINLKTAKTLGIKVPRSILLRATKVIE